MPQAVIGAAISAGIAVAAGATAAAVIATFAGSLILGALSYALTPKPKLPNVKVAGTTVSVRQSDLTRQHVYGHTRITRGYACMQSTGVNGTLHIILMLCEGPLRSINEIWANDYCIHPDWIDDDGNITQGRYKGFMTIRKHLGEANQTADSVAVGNIDGWTNNHRLRGIAYLYITMKKNQDVFPTGLPNISAIVEGPNLYDARTGTLRWSTNIGMYCHDFLRSEEYGYGIFEDDVDETNVAAQLNICDEIVDTEADDTEIAGIFPSTDLIQLEGDLLKYQFGDRVELITAGTPPGGISTGTSYYVIPYQVKTKPRIHLATTLQNAMDKDYINISSEGSGTMTIRKTGEPRYHGSGIVERETAISETMNNLVACMAGRAISTGGFWTLLAGAWRTPIEPLGIDDMRGEGLSFKTDLSMSESFNVVKGLFVSSLNMYQPSDYPAARYEQFIEDDNNIEAVKEINLQFTNRPTTAQRIAKIELFRGRQGIVVTSPFSLQAMKAQPGDVIELTVERYGWIDKPFEITEFKFIVENNALLIRLTLRETAQQIYDWSQGEAIEYDPAPNSLLPNPFDVLVPTGVQYNSRLIETAGGDSLYMVQLSWDLHPDAFVREFGDFEIQYKLSSVTDWLPSFFVDGELLQTDVFTAAVNTLYDIRIRARNNLGVRSDWAELREIRVGSSGGVTVSNDWDYVYNSVTTFNDWGNAADAPTTFDDWGSVF